MRRRGFNPFRLPWGPISDTPPALQRAHEFMNEGDYTSAAILFEQIARGAESRLGPRAPFLYIQAGNARIMLGQLSTGMAHFKHGLDTLIKSGRYTQLYHLGTRVIKELKSHGFSKEAQEISNLVHSNMPASAEMPTERGPNPAMISLPTNCPACGGPLRPDEVDWLDTATGECPYCGNLVQNK
jgi:hypothetical protein